jgi:hypothetical protein
MNIEKTPGAGQTEGPHKHRSGGGHGRFRYHEPLSVVTVLNNPLRYRSRYQNYDIFAKHVEDEGAILYTVELAYGNRDFVVTQATNPRHIQVRTRDVLFHKENLANIGVSRLPLGTKHVALMDADMTYIRPGWADETLHQLQRYDVVQMYNGFTDFTPDGRPYRNTPSLMYFRAANGGKVPREDGTTGWGAPGGAWAYNISAFSSMGGMLDTCILGSGDWHMAIGLLGKVNTHVEVMHVGSAYATSLMEYQERVAALKLHVGYVPYHMVHHFHGSKSKRGYENRWHILRDHAFNPGKDLRRNWQGVLELTGNKPGLRDAVNSYFDSRDEDSTELASSERPLY